MKVLVLGSGGREHALIKALGQSASVTEVHVIPGNPGMMREALCHALDWKNTEELIRFCVRTEIDYVMVGPEDPLVAGVADLMRERGILVVGPGREASQLEGSKIYAKEFMVEAKVPTAPYFIVENVEQTLQAAQKFTAPYVLKADGLAAGKGVFICKTIEELKKAATDLFENHILGSAGSRALLEKFMPGWELSFLVLTNGKSFETLPLAQDHKRLLDGDEGPNTGGMGTVAPLNIPATLREKIENQIIKPTVALIEQKNLIYRGVLFIGVMVTEEGPQVLEFNVRFGDPETQVILPLLEGDWGLTLRDLARGQMVKLRWKNLHSCCVVMAAPGYPQQPQKGVIIDGQIEHETSSSYFAHAGTAKSSQNVWTTNGGRVLGAVGIGSSNEEAIRNAYNQASQVSWKHMQMRKDIGAKKLS